jgi:hypothetical protein
MTVSARKAAIAAYKERPVVAGVFAVQCTATGQAWVGTSTHIDTHQNGLWFTLKLGGYPYPSLQQAWNEHGPQDFRFEQLDRLPEDVSALRRGDELKKRATLWAARLQAERL